MSRLEGGCGSHLSAFDNCSPSRLEREHQSMASPGVFTVGLDIAAQSISAHKLLCSYLEPHCCRRKLRPAGRKIRPGEDYDPQLTAARMAQSHTAKSSGPLISASEHSTSHRESQVEKKI